MIPGTWEWREVGKLQLRPRGQEGGEGDKNGSG